MVQQWTQRLGRPLVLGHRGAMGHAPENTLLGFEVALALGAAAVELDVQLAADGVVVIHDETVDRTTNGRGAVGDLTVAQLQTLDAGSHFKPEFAGAVIPTLEEVLVWAKDRLPVVIELKFTARIERLTQACLEVVDRLEMSSKVVFISFDHQALWEIKQQRPTWETGILYVGRVMDPAGLARSAQADGLMPNFHYLTPDLVHQAHQAGLWVSTWTPNTELELQRTIALGVDMMATNYPARLRALLG
ncbi:glycerophosphodiester phosphodiesterase family protein [Candidatus Cyanaurora vandensis]|uniref:glycerophosphodiester phosphodiesterase n=1 Tax=Candidatus Cyanaurora vandensis TaxID=2714958 RepID=UPI00257E9C87|nr:glycerophosphodiester phosphodiesterase family protein [Candidatus Cyanaurora vandensis]